MGKARFVVASAKYFYRNTVMPDLKSGFRVVGSIFNSRIIVLCLIVLCSSIPGGRLLPGQQDDLPEPEELSQLVQQLGADTFDQRRVAMQALLKAGVASIEPLMNEVETGETDAQMRALAVLSRMAVSEDETTSGRAQTLIEDLVDSDDPEISRMARRTFQNLGRQLQQSAIEQLRSHGARVAGQTVRGNANETTFLEITIDADWTGQRRDLRPIRWLVDLTRITLHGPLVDDELVASMEGLPKLGRLTIRHGAITDAAVRSFSKMLALRRLEILYCNLTDQCADDLKRFETRTETSRVPVISLVGTELSMELADQLNQETELDLDVRRGAFFGIFYQPSEDACEITRVIPDSSAQRGGVRAGDIMRVFDGRVIENGNAFGGAVRHLAPGDEIVVTIEREGKSLDLPIVLGEIPEVAQN